MSNVAIIRSSPGFFEGRSLQIANSRDTFEKTVKVNDFIGKMGRILNMKLW